MQEEIVPWLFDFVENILKKEQNDLEAINSQIQLVFESTVAENNRAIGLESERIKLKRVSESLREKKHIEDKI